MKRLCAGFSAAMDTSVSRFILVHSLERVARGNGGAR